MSANELRDFIVSLCSHVTFDFHGKSCGVDPLAPDQIDLWCGDDTLTAASVSEAMNTPFFDGKSLNEIADKIENVE